MFDSTLGGASANSYVSLAEASDYFAARVGGGAWATASQADQEQALQHATMDLDRLRYKSQRSTTTQALEFPRSHQRQFGVIPTAVQRACCEQALWLLTNVGTGGKNRTQQLRQQGVIAFQVGDHSQQFAAGQALSVAQRTLCPDALDYLRAWVAITGKIRRRRRCFAHCGGPLD